MTTQIGSLAVSLSLDASSFNGGISQVDRNLRAMGSELKATKALGAEYGKSLDGLASKKDILSRSLEAAEIKLKKNREAYDKLTESGKANDAQLERAAKKVNDAQAQYNNLATELKQVDAALKIQSSSWTQMSQKLEPIGAKLTAVGDQMTGIGKNLSMKVTAPIMALGGAAFKAAVDFESAFAGVRKTVDGTEAEFAALSTGIRDMAKEIPAAATEIAGIAEAAGQLGIKKESILGFTRVMADLGVATNMTSEQAATALARMANITNMDQSNFDKLGSSVVALGNNFAATEGEIVEMALRLAGAGAQIGMSEADILGLSAALSSVGIEAEMGGSAMSKAMVRMQISTTTGFEKMKELTDRTGVSMRDMQLMASNNTKGFTKLAESLGMTKSELGSVISAGADLENFSKIAGMTANQFVDLFQKDAVGALGAFINGLGNAEAAGDSAINMLQEMGITEIRLRDSLLRAGNASELFANAIGISNKGWTENNALTKEASERYKTTASQIKILWNDIKDLGMEFGNVLIPVVKDGINTIKPWISSLSQASDGTKKAVLAIGALAAAAGPLLVIGGSLMSGIGGLVTTTTALTGAIGAAGGASAVLTSALTILAGPVGWTVAGIAGLTAIIGGSIVAYEKATEVNLEAIEAKQAEIDANDDLIKSFDDLHSKNRLTTDEMLRFLDINAELEMTNAPDAVAALKDEQSRLLEKSTLTNGQMDEFLELNKRVIDEAPETVKSISLQGEAYANNTLALKELNAEKARELQNAAYETLTKALEQEVRLEKEKNKLIEERNEKEALLQESKKTIQSITSEIAKKEALILELEEQKNGASVEKIVHLDSQIKREQEILTNMYNQKAEAEHLKITYGKQFDERAKLLETNRQELAQLEEAKFKYEEIILAQAGITSEKGNGLKQIDNELMKLELQKRHLSELLLSGKTNTAEYQEQNAKIDQQISKLQTAKSELQLINDVAGKTVYKSVVIQENPSDFWSKLDENLKRPITKNVNIRYNGVSGPQEPGYAKGTSFHPGGRFIAGEEGWELGRLGNKWEMLNLGMYDRPAGFEVFTHAESKKIVSALNRTPGYATGASAIGAADSVVNALNRPIELKIVSELSGVITASKNVSKGLMAEVSKVLTQGTKQVNSDIVVINKKANEEAKKIEKRANEDIYQIKKNATSKKRKLTSAELLKIQRLEEDTAAKVKKINEKAASDVAKLNEKSGKERLDALKLFVEEKKQMEQLSLVDEVKIWEASVSAFKNGTKEKVEAQKAYQKALKAVNDEITSTNKEYSDKMKAINDDLKKSEQELTDKYDSTLNSRISSLRSFAGLFDEFTYTMEKSGSDLLMNLSSQVEGFRTWQSEMDKFASKRVDSGLIEEIRAMGPSALPELLALNSLTEEHLTIYSNLYKDKAALARTQAEKELAGMKKDTEENINELRKTANTELEKLRLEWVNKIKSITKSSDDELKSLKTIGENAGKGLLDGLASMEPALTAKAKSIANSISAAMKSALQVKSPSRVTMGIGRHIGEGLVIGMEQMNAMVKNTAAQLAQFATPSVDDQSYGGSVNRNNRAGVPPQNDRPIIIQPAPIILDGRTIGEVVFETINNMQYNQTSISAIVKGVSLG